MHPASALLVYSKKLFLTLNLVAFCFHANFTHDMQYREPIRKGQDIPVTTQLFAAMIQVNLC